MPPKARTPTTGTPNPKPDESGGLLEGIKYADDPTEGAGAAEKPPSGAAVAAHALMAPETPPAAPAALGPDAGRAAVAEMRRRSLTRKELLSRGVQPPKPVLAPPDPEVQKRLRPELYRVLEKVTLPRGSSTITLHPGKVLSSNEYNIADLESRGVKMAPYEGEVRR